MARKAHRALATAALLKFKGDSGSGGITGLVPKPESGDAAANKVLQADGTWGTGLPTACIQIYAGLTEPTGWLFCYGQAVSRTTYAALYAVVADTYGAGDGSTTFNLPDIRGRVVAGQDDMGGTSANRLTGLTNGVNGDTLGASGGRESFTLTTNEMPAHTHGAGSYETVETNVMHDANNDTNNQTGGGGNIVKTASQDQLPIQGTSSSAGSGAAMPHIQPTIILNYIIKT